MVRKPCQTTYVHTNEVTHEVEECLIRMKSADTMRSYQHQHQHQCSGALETEMISVKAGPARARRPAWAARARHQISDKTSFIHSPAQAFCIENTVADYIHKILLQFGKQAQIIFHSFLSDAQPRKMWAQLLDRAKPDGHLLKAPDDSDLVNFG
ncbi:unnamed protein product [Protopolystoma xenopodis]|uniref:Uncharacterized protein n=1 Tax=Protopolystoma xenopodis TaxID=117903 RepID=A0A448WME1_9PLAT|nr:unnamed protein product [Protopolystoma xenopodis]